MHDERDERAAQRLADTVQRRIELLFERLDARLAGLDRRWRQGPLVAP